jgi:hypothetical protein
VTGARFCHFCGAELPLDNGVEWYYDPVFVLLSIFLLLGVFGLPLLWRSPRFTQWQKTLFTALTLAYTAFVLGLAYYLFIAILAPYLNLLLSAT